MTSQIDPTLPVAGTPTTASVRGNFQTAHDEITALQAAQAGLTATQIAISPAIGSLGPNVQTGLSTLNTNSAPIQSPAFQGNPTGPTPPTTDNSFSLATTAFVHNYGNATYLPLSGGSLTGGLTSSGQGQFASLTVQPATGGVGITMLPVAGAGNPSLIMSRIGSNLRWNLAMNDGGGETGGNAGSNWSLSNYTDAGTQIGSPIVVTRSSGLVTLNYGLTVNANDVNVHSPARIVAPTIVMSPNGTTMIGNTGFSYDGGVNYFGIRYQSSQDSYPLFVNGNQVTNIVTSNNASGAGQQVIKFGAVPSQNYAYETDTSNIGAWNTWAITVSDRRMKRNIEPAGDALSIVERLAVYTADQVDRRTDEFHMHLDFTLIADEVEAALPSAYIPPGPTFEEGNAGLNPLPLIATLWRGMQQLTERLKACESQLAAMHG